MWDLLKFGLACFVPVFTIVNPFSAAGLLVALTPGETLENRKRQARGAVVFATTIMALSYFAGKYVLLAFSISQLALVLAAGFLVCRSGFRTVTGTPRLTPAQTEESVHKEDISLTPLGMPMLAGPGTLFISTISSTQQQAEIWTFFFTMPAFILSGFAFPIDNMPGSIQPLTYAIALRYFLVIIRGVFLKGIGLDILWPQMAALAGLGGAMILLSSIRFRKRLK